MEQTNLDAIIGKIKENMYDSDFDITWVDLPTGKAHLRESKDGDRFWNMWKTKYDLRDQTTARLFAQKLQKETIQDSDFFIYRVIIKVVHVINNRILKYRDRHYTEFTAFLGTFWWFPLVTPFTVLYSVYGSADYANNYIIHPNTDYKYKFSLHIDVKRKPQNFDEAGVKEPELRIIGTQENEDMVI